MGKDIKGKNIGKGFSQMVDFPLTNSANLQQVKYTTVTYLIMLM